jgi:hypothetical protein
VQDFRFIAGDRPHENRLLLPAFQSQPNALLLRIGYFLAETFTVLFAEAFCGVKFDNANRMVSGENADFSVWPTPIFLVRTLFHFISLTLK